MLGPTVLCSSAQAFFPAMVERAQGRERLRSRLALSVLKIIATIVVFSGVPLLPGTGAEEVTSVSPACTASVSETTCTCSDPAAAASAAAASESKQSATLSTDTNILSVNCSGNLLFAPADGGNGIVCSVDSGNLATCNLEIVRLLAGTSKEVKWEACNNKDGGENTKCKSLSVPQSDFPFVDQKFAVGCTDSGKKVCKVPVTIKARTSETNGQTVTCAYGASSNESRQAVTLNPSKNSFTLVCGDKGTVLPTNYETKFCSSDPEKAKETCDGDYQSILPGFEEGWWKNDDPTANSFTLSIPVEKFPKEQAKMVVACQQEKESSGSKTVQWEAATSSVCRVDVTIEAGSPASLSLGSRHFSSWLLAFAVTFVMARGI
ncbi:SAG-related sequence [Besnoitia besnoiti]|uniref:SAG-related sequence n=1 Tax=Besnoitia besnoiti TaxID=94643 RepID=A0A2A9MKY0_BESBE|nr:SAG-related sequence [Besnoitia besnoiti]PFH36092.1 SAG-related sequence [Besnoitia besnoiti]